MVVTEVMDEGLSVDLGLRILHPTYPYLILHAYLRQKSFARARFWKRKETRKPAIGLAGLDGRLPLLTPNNT